MVSAARPLRAPVELLLGPVHVGDRRDGRDRGLRQHGQRRPLRDPLPRHQPRARPDRPARLAHDQRLLRRRHQHRRGQLPAHRRRGRGGALGHGLAVHQPPARARLGRARRADRARRRVRDRRRRCPTACCTSGRRRSSRASCSPTARSSTCRPTRHMDGNLFRTHASRLAVQPRHDRHRPGHPDDRRADRGDLHAAHPRPRDRPGERQLRVQRRARPRRGDRVQAGGIIQTRAQEVLAGAHELLERIAETRPVRGAIEEACSATSAASVDEGRGIEGIVETERGLLQPGRAS